MRRIALLIGVAAATALVTWMLTRPSASEPLPARALNVVLPEGQEFIEAAVAPDGASLAYTAVAGGRVRLFLRPIGSFRPTPLPGTEDATQPFFAPDGQRVGFFASGFLRWIAIGGESPVDVVPVVGATAGGTWGPDDQIVFATLDGGGLSRVSVASGSQPVVEEITRLDDEAGEVAHGWPHFLPDGRALLFTVGREGLDPRMTWMSLDADSETDPDERDFLAPVDGAAFHVDSGHLVYARRGEIFAMPVDAAERVVTGPARLVTEGVAGSAAGYLRLGRSTLVAARNGLLVFAPLTEASTDNVLTWVDRTGSVSDVDGVPARHQAPRLSPDGTQIAMTIQTGPFSRDVWVLDWASSARHQVTRDAGDNHSPVWTPDGRSITFASNRDGPQRIYQSDVDRPGVADVVIFGDGRTPGSWSSDGGSLFFHERLPDRGRDIWVWARETGESSMILGSNANERSPAIAPDGQWLAYVSDAANGDQVYLRPYPGADERQVSTTGGAEPVWSRDGRALFYRNGRDLFTAEVDTETGDVSPPEHLFAGAFWSDPGGNVPSYDVNADGSRFVMLRTPIRSHTLFVVDRWLHAVFPDGATGEP